VSGGLKMQVVFWENIDGENPCEIWKSQAAEEQVKTADSLIACIKALGMKCKFVKNLELEGLHELRSKSLNVRVYFYVKKREQKIYILGMGEKKNQKIDIIHAYNRMKGVIL
jgi:phage-related protein